jgi:ribosome maturation factor RimP
MLVCGEKPARISEGNLLYKMEGYMAKRNYETKTEELLAPIAADCGVEIYDVEYVKEGNDWYLRAYIDKPEGVSINDCEKVSRALSDALDREDFIEDAYILEVSSPGLGRTLKKDRHLEKSIGQEVEIKTYKPVDKTKEFAGILKSFDEATVTIEQEDGERTFQRNEIALIRLALDF